MATATEIRRTYTDFAKHLYGPKAVYAVAGVGDLAVEKLKQVPDRVSKLRDTDAGVPARVRRLPKQVANKITDLPTETRKFGDKVTDRVDARVRTADERYGDLVNRGESIVRRVRNQKSTGDLLDQARSTVSKARGVRGAAERGTKNTRTAGKATVTSAKRTANKATVAAADAAEKVGD